MTLTPFLRMTQTLRFSDNVAGVVLYTERDLVNLAAPCLILSESDPETLLPLTDVVLDFTVAPVESATETVTRLRSPSTSKKTAQSTLIFCVWIRRASL